MTIRVTATDIETGETGTVELDDDYVLICAGSCRQDYVQRYANGTHVITVKGAKQKEVSR